MFNAQWDCQWLGKVPYAEGLEAQQQARKRVKESGTGLILGLEHPRVITYGRRLKNEEPPQEGRVPLFRVNRGGQATLHNPGQLVVYPIMPLREWGWGVKEYVEMLLKATSFFLERRNITIISSNNGIYTANGKIASVGINVEKGISGHGIAINISNDLSDFSLIAPCGVQNSPMDRVAAYGSLELPEAFSLWCREFKKLSASKHPVSLTSEMLSL